MRNTYRLAALPLLAMALVPAGSAPAQSITTLYAQNNQGSVGGAVYFDANVTGGGSGLSITSFDINTTLAVGGSLTLTVYTVPGTSVGNEPNMSAWTQVAMGTGTSAGPNLPTHVDTTDFPLAIGNWGIALVLTGAAHAYTNGTGANQTYSNTEITLNLGAASNVPFTGAPFTPRVWNGSIYYAPGGNLLSITQSGPGVGDLTATLTQISPTAAFGYTLVSSDVANPPDTGPILGLWPVSTTWEVLTYPYLTGNPFHFSTLDPAPFFPTAPFGVAPGTLNGLTGQTLDFVCLLLNAVGSYDSRSNLVRITFQ